MADPSSTRCDDEEAFRPFPPCSPRLAVGSTGWAARLAVGLVPAEYRGWHQGSQRGVCHRLMTFRGGPAVEPAPRSPGLVRCTPDGCGRGCGPRRSRYPAGASSSAFLAMARFRRVPVPGWRCRRPTRSSARSPVSHVLSTCSTSLRSWPVYLERGRRRITAAPRVVVSITLMSSSTPAMDRLGEGAGQRPSRDHYRPGRCP